MTFLFENRVNDVKFLRLRLRNESKQRIADIRQERENDDNCQKNEIDERKEFLACDEFETGETANTKDRIQLDGFKQADNAWVESKRPHSVDKQKGVQSNR
jgi:hypothetical protein